VIRVGADFILAQIAHAFTSLGLAAIAELLANRGDRVADQVPVDPLQYRHDLRDPIAGARELTMREPHEFVGRAKAAGQQKR
jgi:hypothetical protein